MDYQDTLRPPFSPAEELAARLAAATADVLDVQSIRSGDRGSGDRIGPWLQRLLPPVEIRGRLRLAPERAYDLVAARFRALGHIALLRRDGDDDLFLAVPGALPEMPAHSRLAIGLFLATLLSVIFTGAMYVGIPLDHLARRPWELLYGWPFAASLLGILLAHELGHFIVARRLGVPATLPYFIPFPLSPLGTMGAVIRMKAPPRNKRHLLAVAVAGPLAGLIVAIPVLVVGLRLSEVSLIPSGEAYFQEGNSLLYAALKLLVFGRPLPSGGEDVFLHPVAFAGWAGLLVTALNLIPAGQLDGGHVVNALLGRRALWLTYAIIAALLALSLLSLSWLLWAGLVFLFGRIRLEPLDDVTPLRARERALAVLMLVVFILVFTPVPMSL